MHVVDDECGHKFNITLAYTDFKTLHMILRVLSRVEIPFIGSKYRAIWVTMVSKFYTI
jgi:hypothetical protein